MIHFDPTITLDSIIAFGSVIALAIGGYYKVLRRMDKIEAEDKLAHQTIHSHLDLIWDWFKEEHAMGAVTKDRVE
jgi:uncharacterized membrane protein